MLRRDRAARRKLKRAKKACKGNKKCFKKRTLKIRRKLFIQKKELKEENF